jgi:hypothetical protein
LQIVRGDLREVLQFLVRAPQLAELCQKISLRELAPGVVALDAPARAGADQQAHHDSDDEHRPRLGQVPFLARIAQSQQAQFLVPHLPNDGVELAIEPSAGSGFNKRCHRGHALGLAQIDDRLDMPALLIEQPFERR